MNFIRNNKFFLLIAVPAVALFLWAQFGAFKIFKPESGSSWSPNGNHGSVHHK